MWHQAGDGVVGDDGVGVDAHEDLGIAQMLNAIIERFRLAGVGFRQNKNPSRSFLLLKGAVRHFQRAVFGAVINHNHAQVRIVGVKRSLHRALDDFLFVIGGDEHGHAWFVQCDLGGTAQDALMHAIIDGGSPDKEQTSGHEQVAEEEDPGNHGYGGIKQPESKPVETGDPALPSGQRRHNFCPGFA